VKYVASQDGASTTFLAESEKLDVEEGDTVFAYYPYNIDASDGISCRLDAQNNDRSVSDLDYMYATGIVKDGKISFQFQHFFTFLKVTLSPSEYGMSFQFNGTDVNINTDKIYIKNKKFVLSSTTSYSIVYDVYGNYDSDTSFYVALLPTAGDVLLRFYRRNNNSKDFFSKKTPKDGLLAGNIYSVSFDTEIEEYATVSDKQRQALVDLYNATDGEHWYSNTNWCTDKPLEEWARWWVCDWNGNILKWNLSDNNLTGTLPESFSDLMSYVAINVSANNLYGDIPSSVTSSEYWNRQWSYIICSNNFNTKGVPAPTFSLNDMNGNRITSDVYAQNKLTLLLRWAAWCPYSAMLIPQLVSLYRKYHDKGFEILGFDDIYGDVYMDSTSDTKSDIEQAIKENGITWPNILEAADGNNLHFALYVPQAYIVDSEGKFVFTSSYCDAPEFVTNYFDGSDLYTSTDYSKDGEVFTIQSATVGEGIDLVFVGDGFVDTDMESGGKYEQKMQEATETFFSCEPYKSFRNRFNVYGVKVVSANAEWTETAKDHAIDEDMSVAMEYATKAVGETYNPLRVGVIYNADWYVGRSYTGMFSDGSFVGFLMEPVSTSINTLMHEFGGHGFAQLLDEYVESGYENVSPTEDDKESFDEQWENYSMGANVDWRSDPTTIRWAHFIADSRYASEEIGAYEGAATIGLGMYRPTENSMMRYNDSPFNAPSREQIYKQIMRYSEGDSWTYDYETFVTYDAINRNAAETRAVTYQPPISVRKAHAQRHRAPMRIKGNWRDYLKKNKKR
jgi:thiol-disulfide isomerase/thioredoxin